MTTKNTSLEARHYVATAADMDSVADSIVTSSNVQETASVLFFRSVLATAKHELGYAHTARKNAAELDPDGRARELAAVDKVNNLLYPALVAGVDKRVPKNEPDRKERINRLTNGARTHVYAIRTWIRAGRSLAAVSSDTASKRSLDVARRDTATTRRMSAVVLRKRVTKQAAAFMAEVLALAEADKAAAVGELELLVGQLTQQLEELSHVEQRTNRVLRATPTRVHDSQPLQARPS